MFPGSSGHGHVAGLRHGGPSPAGRVQRQPREHQAATYLPDQDFAVAKNVKRQQVREGRPAHRRGGLRNERGGEGGEGEGGRAAKGLRVDGRREWVCMCGCVTLVSIDRANSRLANEKTSVVSRRVWLINQETSVVEGVCVSACLCAMWTVTPAEVHYRHDA